MMYQCENCNYKTTRKQNLERHKNRKISCDKSKIDNAQKSYAAAQKSYAAAQKSYAVAQKSYANFCTKCNRQFANTFSYKRHELVCKGIGSKQCPICLKKFNSVNGKLQHIKNVKCVLNISKSNSNANNTSHTIQNQTNIYNTTNNTTNNIQINCFGKEDLTYLLQDADIIQKLKSFGKSGVYGFPKIISDVHFNNNKPENNTIMKPEEYGDGVMIKNEDNEWEFREFEDIREDLIDTIVKYFKAYNVVKKNLGIQLIERKERNIIKNFGYELMMLDGTIPKDLLEELEMDEEDIDESEEYIKNKTRKFDKSTMRTLHSKTSYTYKKENGKFVLK